MEQLLIHLFADYWLQNDWMASNKKRNFWIAVLHAFIYTIPFLLITQSISSLAIIFMTHALIDGTDVVTRLNQIKNWNFKGGFYPIMFNFMGDAMQSSIHIKDGFDDRRPEYIRVWLLIFQDNILHLVINYIAITYGG